MSTELKQDLMRFLQDSQVAHLATVEGSKPWLRVMSTARIDDDFTLWYATFEGSNKVRQIEVNGEVCVTYYVEGMDARIFGTAKVLRDPESKEHAWRETYAQFFPQGPADPEYVVIKITPDQVYFRDFKKHGHEFQQVL